MPHCSVSIGIAAAVLAAYAGSTDGGEPPMSGRALRQYCELVRIGR